MKAFEEWWKKTLMSNNQTYEIIAKESWKAALEWVLSCDTGPETKELLEGVLQNE